MCEQEPTTKKIAELINLENIKTKKDCTPVNWSKEPELVNSLIPVVGNDDDNINNISNKSF